MPHILILDPIAEEGLSRLEQTDQITYEVKTGLEGAALHEALLQADGAIVRSGTTITAESLANNPRLKGIVRAGVGTDNIDSAAATRAGIVVMNTPTGNTISTAEHTFAMLLGLSRNIAPAFTSLKEGRWERKTYLGSQLAQKTLGIIGLGRIGQEVAKRAVAFEMRVIGFDPFISRSLAESLHIELFDQVEQMLPEIDYLTVHTPLTAETKHLISDPQLKLIKTGAKLINCARGGIYDEAALARGLASGKLSGVALDVYPEEPCTENPLFQMPQTLCTPHLGASTEEAQLQVTLEAIDLLTSYLATGQIKHAVNMAALDRSTIQSLQGYLDLAYRLGLFAAQRHGQSIDLCRIVYRGEIADKQTDLLSAALCSGLLAEALDEEVNLINAKLLLRDRGITLEEQSLSQMHDFSSSVMIEIVSGDQTYRTTGTLFGNHHPRLIQLDDFRLEATLDGTLLVFSHRDMPGVIGRVGTIFGSHDVNIAQMIVGRKLSGPGGPAVGLLNLDNIPSQTALELVQKDPDIVHLDLIEMPQAGELPPWLQEM